MNELFDELRRLGEQIQETMSKITDLMPNKQYNQADDYIKRIYSGAAEVIVYTAIVKQIVEKE